jgi:Domain of unknown function (DUF4328)
MWATGGVAVITGVLAFAALNSFDNYHGARSGSFAERRAYGDWIEMDDTFTGVAAVLFFLWIAVFVVTIIWMNKAHKATQRLWHGPRKWTSGWAVGGFFIPAANFFIPKLVMNEIERIAKATRSNGLVDSSWRGESTSVLGWLWWIGTAVGLLFVASGSSLVDGIEASADEIRSGYAMQGLAWFGAAAACACGALFIRKIGGRLSPAGLAQRT